jgi:tetratricopeptide (TPR) repeat protein
MRTAWKQALLAAVVGLAPAAAGADADGGTESNLGLGASSRGIALGGAWLARADDASALYWNPGRLAALERGAALVTHAPIGFGDATQTFAGAAYPTLGAGTFGIGMLRLATGGIDAYDAASRPQGTIEFAETALYLAWARGFEISALGRVEMGASLKTLTQTLGERSSTGPGLDMGFAWAPRRRDDFALGLVVRDAVSPATTLDAAADRVPATWQFGAAYRPRLGARLGLEVHTALDRVAERGWSPRVGLECGYRALRFRLGASRQGAAFGLGLGWQSYDFDYAYLARADAATHPVTIAAGWGSARATRVASRESKRAADMRAHIQELLEARLASAQAAYDAGDYATAIDAWKVVAGLDPTEERAQRGIAAAGGQLAAAQARALADREQAAARAAQFELGLRAYGQSDHALARDVWTRLLAEDPANSEVQRYLDKTEQALREQVGAQAEEARRLESAGDVVGALAAWSRVHAADARHPEAEPALERCRAALERPRRVEPARSRRGTAAVAETSARTVASEGFRHAVAAYAAGDLQRAVALLEEVRRSDPNHRDAQQLLAKAQRQLQPLGAEDRARVRELYLRGMGHFTAQQFEAAIAEWNKILELDPRNTAVYQNIREARARLRAVQP